MSLNVQELCGYHGSKDKALLEDSFSMLPPEAKKTFQIVGDNNNVISRIQAKYGVNRMMLFEVAKQLLGEYPLNYAQEVGDPFVAGTMVLMADGSEKKIEDLVIGDIVVNHKNQPVPVNNIIKKKFTGDLVTIKVKGWHRELTATEFHHGMVLPYSKYRFTYEGTERMKFGDMGYGDYILTPFGYEPNEDIVIDLTDIVNPDHFDKDFVYLGKNKLPRFIPVDNKFARLIGLYLAEGGVHLKNNSLSWSYNVNEILYIQETINAIKEIFGLEAKVWKTGVESCRRVGVCSALLCNFFTKIIPGNIYSKGVPDFIFRTRRSIRLEVLRGWLDGDGDSPTKSNRVVGYTSSDRLGNDMLRLATSCGLRVSSWRRMRKQRSRVPNTEVGFFGTEVQKVYSTATLPCSTKIITCRDTPYGLARKITSTTREAVVDHEVYCITTEGEYTAIFNGIAQYQCVSFGGKNAAEYLQAFAIALGHQPFEWKKIFPPYLWGAGRIFIGKNQLGRQDGSLGTWQAQAMVDYGVLNADAEGVPQYSGQVARQWGNSPGPADKWVQVGKNHLVKSIAQIRSVDEAQAALMNGYPIMICSNVGFDMHARQDGFMHASTRWDHCMCLIGFDAGGDGVPENYCILNSWGDQFGRIKDFRNKDLEWPPGTLRVTKGDIQRILDQGDSWSVSNINGFPARTLPEEFFDMI